MKAEQIHDLISKIYDATLDTRQWPVVLQELAHGLGARGAILFELEKRGGETILTSPFSCQNFERPAVDEYLKHFNALEVRDQELFAKYSGRASKITLFNDCEVMDLNEDLEQQPHVQFFKQFGIKHRVGAVLNKDSWNIDRFSLQYDESRGPMTQEEKQTASLILPHMAKALRIGRSLAAADFYENSNFSKMTNGLRFGVAIITPDERLQAYNEEFERILENFGIFQLTSKGTFRIRDESSHRRFNSLMQTIDIHAEKGAYPRDGALSFLLHNENLEQVVLIEVSPASHHPNLGSFPDGTRIISAFDSALSRQIDPELVGRFFGLSETECETLQLLVQGYTNQEIAEHRSRGVETINSQVKSLLQKTYTRNRTELAQLSLSLQTPFHTIMGGGSDQSNIEM